MFVLGQARPQRLCLTLGGRELIHSGPTLLPEGLNREPLQLGLTIITGLPALYRACLLHLPGPHPPSGPRRWEEVEWDGAQAVAGWAAAAAPATELRMSSGFRGSLCRVMGGTARIRL